MNNDNNNYMNKNNNNNNNNNSINNNRFMFDNIFIVLSIRKCIDLSYSDLIIKFGKYYLFYFLF